MESLDQAVKPAAGPGGGLLIGKLLGLAAREPGSLQPSPARRARRRGLMWRSVAEPLPVEEERANRSRAVVLAAIRLCSVRRSPSP